MGGVDCTVFLFAALSYWSREHTNQMLGGVVALSLPRAYLLVPTMLMCVRDTFCALCPCVTSSFQVHLVGDAGPVWLCNQLQFGPWQSTAGWGSCGSSRGTHCLGSTARYHQCFALPSSQEQTPSIYPMPFVMVCFRSAEVASWCTACVSGRFPLSSHCCKHGCGLNRA
jgi:hypothetical protein